MRTQGGITDKSAADFDAVKEKGVTLVGASALLTTTMLQQGKIIEALQETGLRGQVKGWSGALRSLRNGRARLALMDTLRMPLMLWRLPRNLSASGSRQ
jgi:hypothetical protein